MMSDVFHFGFLRSSKQWGCTNPVVVRRNAVITDITVYPENANVTVAKMRKRGFTPLAVGSIVTKRTLLCAISKDEVHVTVSLKT